MSMLKEAVNFTMLVFARKRNSILVFDQFFNVFDADKLDLLKTVATLVDNSDMYA